ncbi:hypothetical protein BD324DRAFT_680709 [Kockovaella imperatae]|uniref:Transmembrane protein n=1 Tax=Kockovaella imperatae TaxID=4999 RepID=A0A1Y1UIH9_9TREE|nr:hypothetical protein BD324DRAFT_680709 [Kockovaella imperatae]ORX37831.1 hypothetical protein BD324DRAFT_680709 [Kockovaella imperatae]
MPNTTSTNLANATTIANATQIANATVINTSMIKVPVTFSSPTPFTTTLEVAQTAITKIVTNVTQSVIETEIPVTIKDGAVTLVQTTIPVPVPSESAPAAKTPVAGIAALSAVLGVVIIMACIAVLLLLRKLRNAESSNEIDQHHLYSSPELDKTEEGPTVKQLQDQLTSVRRELASVMVLTPSTIRDRSDYARDLDLINDDIRQISMRITRNSSYSTAPKVRNVLCATLRSEILTRFDASLKPEDDAKFSEVMSRFPRKQSALLWKAMAVQNLPVADARPFAEKLVMQLSLAVGESVHKEELTAMTKNVLSLVRALAEDAKGYSLTVGKDGQQLGLIEPTSAA